MSKALVSSLHSLLFLSLLLSCSASHARYKRKDWNHWSDPDGNCLNTRQEILKQRSLVPVTLNKKGCTVKEGKWDDYYFAEVHTQASKVDIDHLVPLKHAHDHGGNGWSAAQKEKFANDPENLVVTNRKYNRIKGAKGIHQWLPVDKLYACKYVRQWLSVKKRYSLRVSTPEETTANTLLKHCPTP